MSQNPVDLLSDFLTVASLAGTGNCDLKVEIEELTAPHVPPKRMPTGKMAVYVFFYRGKALKVGKVGPKSQARFTTQHYIPGSARSTLAGSLLKNGGQIGVADLTEENVNDWIRQNTERWNFMLDASCGVRVLTLLEAFLQCRLQPAFEGFESQSDPKKWFELTTASGVS